MKSREQLEIAMPGSSSWMPYALQGVKGLDDDKSVILTAVTASC
jgi:hypothetical protein